MDFLEVVIGLEEIKIEKEKVKVVLNWLVSKSVIEIQKLLWLANYYKKFVRDFVKIARLLHELTKKKSKWKQEIRQKKLFKVLKKRFITKPILVVLDLDKKIRMEVDTSDYVTERVLLMKCADER